MALTVYRAQVFIPSDTAIPADGITNTWHFKGTNAGNTRTADVDVINARLALFYQDIDQDVFSSLVNTPASVKVYDLKDIEPRIPLDDEFTFTITPGTGNPLPTECALCVSFQAAPVSGLARGRRRGRFYLGPLRDPIVSVVSGRHEVSATIRGTIVTAMAAMKGATLTAGVPWCVFSPTGWVEGGELATEVEDFAYPVDNGWIDNALDTVRSRGTKATSRVLLAP